MVLSGFLVLLVMTFIADSAYINGIPVQKSSITDHEEAKRSDISEYSKQPEDEDVRELENLKPVSSNSAAHSQTQQMKYTDEIGRKEHRSIFREEGSKNSELLDRLRQKMDSKFEDSPHIMTEFEIPREGIHKVAYSSNEEEEPAAKVSKRVNSSAFTPKLKNEMTLSTDGSSTGAVQYSPLEMAAYIYETNDEKTVTNIIEYYLANNIMDREAAITYLEDIKDTLDALRTNSEDTKLREKKQDRDLEKIFEYPKSKSELNEAIADLKEIQSLLRRKYGRENYLTEQMKYNRDRDEDNNIYSSYGSENDKMHLTDKDYRTLIEKLQVFENLFSEASMEEVIYELAKVLFSQSFSLGGTEAQDALKQFTTFLESQVYEGRISRNMERKVLDILISALADIINEHPELMNLARQEFEEKKEFQHKLGFEHGTVEKNDDTSVVRSRIKQDKLKKTGGMHSLNFGPSAKTSDEKTP